jgi:hypothetical protein
VTFVTGLPFVLLVIAVLGGASHALRAAAVPGWDGAIARLAELVIGLALALGTAQVLGAFGFFHPLPVLGAEVGVGAAGWVVGLRVRHPGRAKAGPPTDGATDAETGPRPTRLRSGSVEGAVAIVGTSVVAVQWMTHTADALGRGMTHVDSLWYHLPFAARFVQNGNFVDLTDIGYDAARWFPLNSQLFHALGLQAFGTDAVSPYLNLGWAALALLAAWCIGQPSGRGALAVLFAAAALGVPALAGTQPGQASSDIACAALLLSSAALLLRADDLRPAPVALAGIAIGLAISTKVTIALPVAVFVLGTLVVLLLGRRFLVASLWTASVALTGGFWFVRNWVEGGSPLPWFELAIGPFQFRRTAVEDGPPLAESLFDGDAWHDLYLSGLSRGLGRAWFLVLGLAVAGAVLTVVRGRRFERLMGLVVMAGLVGHIFTPLTGGLAFVFNLRYAVPILMLGLALLSRHLPAVRLGGPVVAVIVLATLLTGSFSPNLERVDAWPTDHLLPVLLVLAAIAALSAACLAPLGADPTRRRAAVGMLAVGLVVVGGWRSERYYLDHRYVDAGLHMDGVHEYFRGVSHSRVAVLGTIETYPMFGLDSSNDTTNVLRTLYPQETECRDWRFTLAGRFDYVVLTEFGFASYPKPRLSILEDDVAASKVARDGNSVVFRLAAPLDPTTCPPERPSR